MSPPWPGGIYLGGDSLWVPGRLLVIQTLTLVVFDATVVLVFVFFLSSFGLIGFNDVSFDDVETGRSFAVLVGATTGGLINLKTES